MASSISKMNKRIKTKRNSPRQILSVVGCVDNEYFCAKIVLMIFKIIGLAPLAIRKLPSIKISGNSKREKFTSNQFAYSKLGCFYNIFLIISAFGISFKTVPLVYDNYYPYKSELTESIEIAESICGMAIIMFLFMFMCAKQNCQVRLLNRLINVNDHIIGLNDSDRHVDSKSYFFLLFLVNTLVWVEVILSDVNAYGSMIFNWVNDIIPGMIINWFILQYVVTLKLIENRFKKLNRILLDTSRFSIVQPIQSLMTGNVRTSAFYVPRIVTFRRAHASLYEISCEVSDFYALPILVTIAFSCYSVIYNAYFLMMPFVLRLDSNTIQMIANSVAWLIGLMLPITMLAVGVDRTTVEMKRTSDAVHKLLTRTTISSEDKIELKEFSLELLQRNVHFTAYGLFTLDCTLVHSIFSTVITYLIILFQFQMSNARNSSYLGAPNNNLQLGTPNVTNEVKSS